MGVERLRWCLLLSAVILQAASEALPAPPSLVSVACGQRSATLQWRPESNVVTPVAGYLIQHNNSFTPDTWENVLPELPPTETQHTVALSPWMNYTFHVVARSSAGLSEPSQLSAVCTTPPDLPQKNPENVRGEGRESTDIVISWNPMPATEHNGPGFVYRVYWKRDDPEEEWSSADIYDWRQNEMIIPDQPTFARYRLKVAAVNQVGESRPPREVIGYSGEGEPTQAPANFILQHFTQKEAWYSWDPVPEETLRGHHRGYTIQTWPEGGDELSVQETSTEVNKTRVKVNIPSGSRVHARVFARNGRFPGPPSRVISFDTPETVPGPVQSFEAHPMGSSSFYLIWRRPSSVANGVLKGYKVYYQHINGTMLGSKRWRAPVISASQTRAKLSGLQPNTQYRLYITALTGAGEGTPYFIEHRTGPAQTLKPDRPHFYWLQGQLEGSVRIVWLPDLEGNPGSHFYVKRRLKGEAEFSATEPEYFEDYLDVNNLLPCRSYDMQLVAVDGDFSTESEVKEVMVETEECSVARNELEED